MDKVNEEEGKKEEKREPLKENYISARPDLVKKLMTAISNGYKIETCCAFAGIAKSTYYSWVKKGKAEFETGDESEYSKFYDNMLKAQSIAEVNVMNQIKKAGDKDWRAASWIMEHRFGYSKTTKIEVEDNTTPQSEDELNERIAKLQAKMKSD